MSRKTHSSAVPPKRRTTLTLPAEYLDQAQRIAHARKVNLSVVVSEALCEGLRAKVAAERSEKVMEDYKKAFSGFSEEEMCILDGIILEPENQR